MGGWPAQERSLQVTVPSTKKRQAGTCAHSWQVPTAVAREKRLPGYLKSRVRPGDGSHGCGAVTEERVFRCGFLVYRHYQKPAEGSGPVLIQVGAGGGELGCGHITMQTCHPPPDQHRAVGPRAFLCKLRGQRGGGSVSPWGRGWTAGPGLGSSVRGDTPWGRPALSGCRVFLLGIPGTRDGRAPGEGEEGKVGFFQHL